MTRVIPRLAEHAEGPLERSIASAKCRASSVIERPKIRGSADSNCEVPRPAAAGLGMTRIFQRYPSFSSFNAAEFMQ